MVSLKDISVRCGVSVATVSKALNGHKDVSEATKRKTYESRQRNGLLPKFSGKSFKDQQDL